MLAYIAFLSCLEFAILNSMYGEFNLKPKQVLCLEAVYLQRDVMCVLPTGYGKSLIFAPPSIGGVCKTQTESVRQILFTRNFCEYG
jgi:superfamily II DNA helicase RecQ